MQPVEIYLSRRAILFFILCALIMLWFGLELIGLNWVFGPEDFVAQPIFIYLAAGFFFGLVPILIIWKQITLFPDPPLILRVDEENVTFGTGFGYHPLQIPTKYLKSVRLGLPQPDGSTLRPEQFALLAGVRLEFERSPDIPSGAGTSAGIRYGNYVLLISRLYGDTSSRKAVAAIQPFIKQ